MHALGRRFPRLAPTFWTALAALAAVAIWGDPAWARAYYVFVAVTGAVLVAAVVTRPRV
jgi:hypothetical protein